MQAKCLIKCLSMDFKCQSRSDGMLGENMKDILANSWLHFCHLNGLTRGCTLEFGVSIVDDSVI